jgi:branched-chain amino acid transport system ATP-binding protein
VQGVSKHFGGVKAVNDVSLKVHAGPDRQPDRPQRRGQDDDLQPHQRRAAAHSGRILFRGQDTAALKPSDYAEAGHGRTFQNLALFRHGTVVENLLIGRHIRLRSSVLEGGCCSGARRGARRSPPARRSSRSSSSSRSRNCATSRCRTLAYGQQKRVELGRALACEPRLLLLDEIVAGMNREEKEDIARFTLDIRDEFGHVGADDRTRHAGRDGPVRPCLRAGLRLLIAEGTPAEVAADPVVLAAYLGAGGMRHA